VAAGLPNGKMIVACGVADAIRIDAATEAVDTIASVPSMMKTGCAIAATSRQLVIAGGTLGDGTVTATADVYDLGTFALVAQPTLAIARTGATAIALGNDQVIIAGGVDATGAPISTLELFTPNSAE
jgi:hypothetical protein